MPQATPELRAKFPGWDAEALTVLEANFVMDKGFIFRKRDPAYEPTQREWDAIDYLFQEWDYGYEASAHKPEGKMTAPYEYKIEKFSDSPKWGLRTPGGLRWFTTKKAAMAMAEQLRQESSAPPSGASEEKEPR